MALEIILKAGVNNIPRVDSTVWRCTSVAAVVVSILAFWCVVVVLALGRARRSTTIAFIARLFYGRSASVIIVIKVCRESQGPRLTYPRSDHFPSRIP